MSIVATTMVSASSSFNMTVLHFVKAIRLKSSPYKCIYKPDATRTHRAWQQSVAGPCKEPQRGPAGG